MFYQPSSLLPIFLARGRAYLSRQPTPRFLFQLSMSQISVQLCFKLNGPAFHFASVGKKGLILFTPKASGQQPPTTPLPVYTGCCYVRYHKYVRDTIVNFLQTIIRFQLYQVIIVFSNYAFLIKFGCYTYKMQRKLVLLYRSQLLQAIIWFHLF